MLFRFVRELSTNFVTLERERKEREGVETLVHGRSPTDFSNSELQKQGYRNFVSRKKNQNKVTYPIVLDSINVWTAGRGYYQSYYRFN
jgi:hypothetical protein